MKFTLSWLKTHLETTATLPEIGDKLTDIGLELEGIDDPAAALAPFRVAHVVSATPHPNADRLRACTVDAGDGPVSVVCGAPNARTGMKAVFAPPGAFIPGSGVTLKTGEIRGVTSAGMLLSAREMGLGEDHDGIVDLPADAPVGTPYAAYAGLDDPVIEIAVTPNRGDALSVRGVARDLAAAGLGTLKPFSPTPVRGEGPSAVAWRIEDPCCQWVLGRTVRGVRNGPSPAWLQRRLRSVGLRPINALADITNFFTHDIGRPLHVFDADRVRGPELVFRPGGSKAGANETFRGLHGRDVTVTQADCVIADAAGPQSLAGVVGGEATSCTDATTNVFIECALFDPVRVALTGRRHGIASDARQRFERGVDPALPPAGLDAATAMIVELCGGAPSEIVSAGAEPHWQRTATLRFERLRTLGGADVPEDQAAALLERLGFSIRARNPRQITVDVPSWRNDIAAPIVLDQSPDLPPERAAAAAEGCAAAEPEADLVEEVLRLRGLDAIPPVSLPRLATVPGPAWSEAQGRTAVARRTLAGRGLAECMTFSFLSRTHAALFGDAPAGLTLMNPIASDLDQLRGTPLATLALAAARNAARGHGDVQLFEIGPAFAEAGQGLVAAGLRTGSTPRQWATASRPVHALDAKGDVLAALAALGLPADSLSVTTDAPAFYHPGRSGTVRQGPKLALATFGELHPAVTAALDLPAAAAGFELFLDRVPTPKRRRRAAPDLPDLQPVQRDFAFLVGADVPADQVLRAVRNADRTLIAEAAIFDVFTGDTLPPGTVSVGIEITLQAREHTLTDAEIGAVSDRVKAAVAKAVGGTLR